MGKKKNKCSSISRAPLESGSASTTASSSAPSKITTTSAVAADPVLGYKVRVLLHDFLNVTKDPNSERRINSTTSEHYISAPYFDENQAATVKAAVINVDLSRYNLAAGTDADPGHEDETGDGQSSDPAILSQEGQSFENAVRALLVNFIEKRRASGDARPCGPHYLAPMYALLFGIDMDQLKDPKFLGRLRRAGV